MPEEGMEPIKLDILDVLWKVMRETKHLEDKERLEEMKKRWKEAIEVKDD